MAKKTYTLEVDDGDGSILKLLNAVKNLGDIGASRTIKIEDDETIYSIDGDGADKIHDIKVSGEALEANDYKAYIKKHRL